MCPSPSGSTHSLTDPILMDNGRDLPSLAVVSIGFVLLEGRISKLIYYQFVIFFIITDCFNCKLNDCIYIYI